jgi:hypothetical protein
MKINFSFDSSNHVDGEASIQINKPIFEVFSFIGEHFYDNYPKWAVEVIDFEPLDGREVFVGSKAKQIRNENGATVESVFQITDYQPAVKLIFKGLTAPYIHSYMLESTNDNSNTLLTFKFELTEIDMFMRPFLKLIRSAIEDGAEITVENIKNLVADRDSE